LDLDLQIGFGSGLDIDEGLEGGSRVGSVVGTSSIFSSVGIRVFSIDTSVVDDVLHGLSHQTTVATFISIRTRAINQVLLRERVELVGGDLVATFSRSSGGERPARTALSLVLNGSDGTFLGPVPSGGGSSGIFVSLFSNGGGRDFSSKVELSVFLVGQVSHVVHGNSVGFSRLVVFINELLVVLEDGISVLEFVVAVGLAMSLHPLNEKVLEFQFSSECKSTGEKDGEEEDGLHV